MRLLIILCILSLSEAGSASLILHSQTELTINLVSYDGLTIKSLFNGSISAESSLQIDTPYRGLALIIFEGGQTYPVIIGDISFYLSISGPNTLPTFTPGSENDLFYKALSGKSPEGKQYEFALLMIKAKQLQDSSSSIHSIKELTAKKVEFQNFVCTNYEDIRYSDMVRRLIAQYFMMHEYIDYHVEGAPATDIRVQYQKAVLSGVENWLEVLKPHIPENEILNYIVSLYYNRSMISLASLIIENNKSAVYCPGEEAAPISLQDQLLVDANRNKKGRLDELKGNKLITFVSDDCPVSMVETVSKARRLAAQKSDVMLIVAPLEKLSDKHLSMNRMVSGGKMLFINDEQWRKENLIPKIRLPLVQRIQ